MNPLAALRALIRKDLRVFASDRRAMIVSFAVPAVLATMMGFIFNQDSDRKPHVNAAAVVLDTSTVGREIARQLHEDPMLSADEIDEATARTALQHGKLAVAIVIPAGFGDKALAALAAGGAPPELTLLYDPSHAFEQGFAQGVVHRVVLRVLQAQSDAGRARAEACASVLAPFTTVPEVVAAGKEWNGAAHMVAGMAVQFILFGAIENAIGILTDRQRGLWKRLQAAPLSRWVLLASKIISASLIAGIVLAFMFVFGHFVLKIEISGSFPGFLLVCASFCLLAGTVGVLISTLGKTPQTTRSFSIFAMLILVMLSGAWFPTFLFPQTLQRVTKFIPTRWAVDGLDGMVWRGLGFEDAILPAAILLGSAVVLGAIAAWRFRWEE